MIKNITPVGYKEPVSPPREIARWECGIDHPHSPTCIGGLVRYLRAEDVEEQIRVVSLRVVLAERERDEALDHFSAARFAAESYVKELDEARARVIRLHAMLSLVRHRHLNRESADVFGPPIGAIDDVLRESAPPERSETGEGEGEAVE